MFQNNHFSLGNDGTQISSKDLYLLNRLPKTDAPYEILIEVSKDVFDRRFKSTSEFYRVLSNSNQSIGIASPVKNYTNRKWWKYHFMGGYYTTYICSDKFYINFVLDLNPNSHIPSELQVKMRILKSFKGYKPITYVGIENNQIFNLKNQFENCYGESQLIGNRYNSNDDLPF